MKICMVTTMFPKFLGDYYGSFVFDDAKSLVKRGFEVHVVTQHNPNIPYEEVMEGIHVHRFRWLEPKEFKALIHFNGLKDNFRLLTYVFALFFNLIRVCRKYDVDIIHAHHAIPTGLFGVIVSKILGKPSFITTHGMDITTHGIAEGPLKNVANFEDHFIFKHMLSYSLRNCDRVLPVSNDLKKRIMALGVKKDKITILRNAVDIDRFTPQRKYEIRHNYNIDDKDIVILFVGHLEGFKGLFELIYAFNNLKKENKKVKLILIGDGSQKIRSKQEIEKLGLNESVFYAGKIPPSDIHEYYQNSDIFVLPSQTDAGGPPVVFIEAMACGLPVIGTNVGGIPEGIENGVNGFIVPTKNENELTKKLELLVNDKDCRVNFGQKSIEKIQNEFNIDKKINKLLEIYQQYFPQTK